METPKYKTALIVGAGEGLSASLARLLFAREGIRVALAARKIEKLGALCSETGARVPLPAMRPMPDDVERLFGWLSARSRCPTWSSTMPAAGRAAPSSIWWPPTSRKPSRSARSAVSWWRNRR